MTDPLVDNMLTEATATKRAPSCSYPSFVRPDTHFLLLGVKVCPRLESLAVRKLPPYLSKQCFARHMNEMTTTVLAVPGIYRAFFGKTLSSPW